MGANSSGYGILGRIKKEVLKRRQIKNRKDMNTQNNLTEFKTQVRRFNIVIESVSKLWTQGKFTTLRTLLQNLGFDGSNCQGYDTEEEVKRCEQILTIFKQVAEYERECHLSGWIAQETDMLWTGYFVMAEDVQDFGEL